MSGCKDIYTCGRLTLDESVTTWYMVLVYGGKIALNSLMVQRKITKVPGHNFRSTNLKDEEKYLQENWDMCICNNTSLLLCSPRIYDNCK